MTHVVLRKRKLGKTSANQIASKSKSSIIPILFQNKDGSFRDSRNPFGPKITFPSDVDLVFRWGCTASVPGEPTIINKAEAIHAVADKVGFRKHIAEIQPHFPCWTSTSEVVFPCVVRPRKHHQGRHLHVCANMAELNAAINTAKCKEFGWYAAPKIDKEAEYRVFVVSGRAVCVAQKTPANANTVAWNVAQGGHFNNVRWDEWPLKAVRISIEAFLKSGLDFGGVDVMVKGNDVYVLEINSAPSLTSPYRQECFAKAFDYIVENGPDVIPLQKAKGDYKKFIHPAIFDATKTGGEQ